MEFLMIIIGIESNEEQRGRNLLLRGCPHITSAAGGAEGVSQKMTIADEGGRGGKSNADDC